jgi:glycine/D-amino acid oxidase-like deaminating enzyme
MVDVIGGGIVGLSIAWRLLQRGLQITVMDAGSRGGEASRAGAGMLAPGGEFVGDKVWTPLMIESHALYPDFVRELSEESGLAIDFRICGGLDVAASDEDWPWLRERARRQAAVGIASSVVADGILYPNDGYVDSPQVVSALRRACEKRGATLEDGHTVGEIDADRSDAVVIAAGAWSGAILVTARGGRLALPKTIPVKGHLLGYRLARGSLPRILRHGHTYMLQRANGYTVAGSSEERIGFDTTIDDGICRDIHARCRELWPELARHEPCDRWIGFRPATEDLLPKIGRFEATNVWLAYGHYRNGILLAPATAQRIADSITVGKL